jgi:hypothetical protein
VLPCDNTIVGFASNLNVELQWMPLSSASSCGSIAALSIDSICTTMMNVPELPASELPPTQDTSAVRNFATPLTFITVDPPVSSRGAVIEVKFLGRHRSNRFREAPHERKLAVLAVEKIVNAYIPRINVASYNEERWNLFRVSVLIQ